jgi:4'-phosphopantetheinyl transferase
MDAEGWPSEEELPAEERERARGMAQANAARRWIAAWWALRLVLGRYLDEEPAAIALRRDEHGKPALACEANRLNFNLSHSAGLALVAVAVGREVGVDIEWINAERDLPALAARGLGAEEASAIRDAAPADRAELFYAAWVRREALVKCLGGGLGNPPPSDPVAVAPLDVDEGYAAAFAVAGTTVPPYQRYTIEPESLAPAARTDDQPG